MKRNRNGFSTVELLTVVVIIAALFAIAVPGMLAVKNNLEMRRLDDTAREIFVAAQNSLTARKAAGTAELLTLESETKGDNGDCWMFETDSGRDALLPDGTIEGTVGEKHFAIYYNEESGIVLEVYFSEAVDLKDEGSDGLSQDFRGDKSARREARVGYYSSDNIKSSNVVKLPTPQVQLLNSVDADGDGKLSAGEDALKLKVSFEKAPPADANVKITLINLDDPSQTFVLCDQPYGTAFFVNREKEWVLDSMEKQFKDLRDASTNLPCQITPGANIKAVVEVTKEPEADVTYCSASGSDRGNSLFSNLDDTGTVTVSSPRQLQNLSSDFSGVNDGQTTVTRAVQGADIDWSQSPLDSFKPISSPVDDASGASVLTAFEGNGYEIRNLKITDSAGGAVGLFSKLNGTELSDIRLNAPVIESSDGTASSVGALIGRAENMKITGCQVYTDSDSLNSGIHTDADTVGGLIGTAENCTIEKCSASLPSVEGGDCVGGLVGTMSDTTVKKSYASTGVRSGEDGAWEQGLSAAADGTVGGLAGSMQGGSLADSFVSGYLAEGAGSGGGLVGNYGSGTVQRCYSVATMGSDSYKGLAGSGTLSGDTLSFWESGAKGDKAQGKSLGEIAALNYKSTAWSTGEKTTGYSDKYCPDAYPYPTVNGLPYYGDWPTENIAAIGVYREGADLSNDKTEPMGYVLVQRGAKPVTVDAVALQNDGTPALSAVHVELLGDISGDGAAKDAVNPDALNVTYHADTGHTSFTLDSTKVGATGVFGVDMTVNDIRTRIVFVVFDVQVELIPTLPNGGSVTETQALKTGLSRFGSQEPVLGQLTLSPANRLGDLTAKISKISPSLEELKTSYAKLEKSTPADVKLLTPFDETTLEAYWNSIDVANDPTISENHANVIDEVKSERVKNVLNIVGKNTGSAFVRAHWAVDDSVYAECRVTMEGARALIRVINLDGSEVGGAYPYQANVEPTPAEILHLTFIPALFNIPDAENGQFSYKWTVYRVLPNGTETVLSQYNQTVSGEDWAADKPYQIDLDDDQSEASYRSVLEFQYVNLLDSTKNQTSVDETNVSVFRRPAGGQAEYEQIKLQEVDYRGVGHIKNDVSQVSVEQVTGIGTPYAGCNKTKVSGYVDGVVNSQVRWYVYTRGTLDGSDSIPEGGTWEKVTGTSGSIQLFDANGVERATVKWNPEDANVTLDGVTHPTGGSVTITGLDNDEYESVFTFRMRAEAVDAFTGETASYKTLSASVMPRLRIDPPSKAKAGSYGETFSKFAANRTDGKFAEGTTDGNPYQWSIKDITNLAKSAQTDNEPSIETYRNNPQKYQIQLVNKELVDNNALYTGHQFSGWKEVGTLPAYEVIAKAPEGVGSMVTRTSLLTLEYGPYQATATYESRRRQVNYPITSINQDIQWEDKDNNKLDYFLIEKGRSRLLQFSWAEFNHAWFAESKPEEDNSGNHATLIYLKGRGRVNWEVSSGWNSSTVKKSSISSLYHGRDKDHAANEETWSYSVTGNSFSRTAEGGDDPLTLSWTLDGRSVSSMSESSTWVVCPLDCTDPTHDHQTKVTETSWGFEYDEIRTTTYKVTETTTYPASELPDNTYSSQDKAKSAEKNKKTVTVQEETGVTSKKFEEVQWNACSQQNCKSSHETERSKDLDTKTESYRYVTGTGYWKGKGLKKVWVDETTYSNRMNRTVEKTSSQTVTQYYLNGQKVTADSHTQRTATEYGYNEITGDATYGNEMNDPHSFDTYRVYVVGMDIYGDESRTEESLVESVTLAKPGETQTLYADAFFPAELTEGTATVRWFVDEPELIQLSGDTESAVTTGTVPSIKVEAKKYSSLNSYATVTCVFTVQDVSGNTRTFTKNIPIYVGEDSDGMLKAELLPCRSGDIPALEQVFGKNGEAISGLWLNQKIGEDYILVENPLFGANVMYLKATVKDLWNDEALIALRDYYTTVFTDDYYVTAKTGMLPADSKLPGKDTTIYIQITQVPDHARSGSIPVELTVEVGSVMTGKETIQLYREPSVEIYEDGALVTGKSWPIEWPREGKQEALAKSIAAAVEGKSYTATLSPALRGENGELLDGIVWYLDSPSGYNVSSYLDFTATNFVSDSGSMSSYGSFSFIRSGGVPLIPDFRVVLNAQSSMAYYGEGPGGTSVKPGIHQVGSPSTISADGIRKGSASPLLSTSGYAVVFLPQEW